MARYNPDLMQLDDGATGAPRVAGPRNTAPISQEELDAENAKYDPATGMPLDLLESGIPELIQSFTKPGFTPGPYPKEFERFFGVADPNMIGYKIVTNEDGSQQLEVQTGAGSTITYGAPIKVGADGTVSPFTKTATTTTNTATNTAGLKTAEQIALDAKLEADKARRKSAYDTLYEEFDQYGLGSLVSDIKNILVDGSLDPTEFSLKVRGTDAYKARFVANEARLAKGLRALSPASYIAMEDKYQEVMRQYGLPESYYAKTGTGVQEGFRKLIENDVSNIELEDRIATAQKRVINANPEVLASLKSFYPDITNGDILAYTLDPKNAIENIKRKVTAAEIGGAATQAGLKTGMTRAEELAAAGITKQQAQEGFQTVAEVAPRGGVLADIYKQNPYTQTTAEAEIFGLAGSAEATRQRKKLAGLETAAFSGRAGAGAIARDRAGVL
jgi:hypothetical protein